MSTATAAPRRPHYEPSENKGSLDDWEARKLRHIYEELCALPESHAFHHPLPWDRHPDVPKPADFLDCDLAIVGEDLLHGDFQRVQDFWDDLHLICHNAELYVKLHENEIGRDQDTVLQHLLVDAAAFSETVHKLEDAFTHAHEGHTAMGSIHPGVDHALDTAADAIAHALHHGYHETKALGELLLPEKQGTADDGSGSPIANFFGGLLARTGIVGGARDEAQGGAALLQQEPITSLHITGRKPRIYTGKELRKYLQHGKSFHSLHEQFVKRGLQAQSLEDVRNYVLQETREHLENEANWNVLENLSVSAVVDRALEERPVPSCSGPSMSTSAS